tara:strand:- start:2628 stop:3071 length:444 start_codon:yes stop_codon:yes gene_type:complete
MPKLGDPTDFSYRISKVTKVVDGDTIDVIIDMGFDIMYKSRVRLFGIDTPESRTRNLDEKKRGLLAKKYLQEALKAGKTLSIKTYKDNETGKFGRILGDVFIDGKSVNAQMVKDFMAVPYTGQSKQAIMQLHESNKKMLIKQGKISG